MIRFSSIALYAAANFTAYTELKRLLHSYQPQYNGTELPSWQTAFIGLISGACGPFTNGESQRASNQWYALG